MCILSESESKYLGYRVGRGQNEDLANEQLKPWLIENKIDVLKLQLQNPEPDLYIQLDALQLPYYVLAMLLELKVVFKPEMKDYVFKPGLRFDAYFGNDEEAFKKMVRDVFEFNAGSYFINPLLENKDGKQQAYLLAEYISGFHKAANQNQFTHLMYYKNELAGFVCSYKEGKGGGVSYAGIRKAFEGKGLYLEMARFIAKFGVEAGQKWGKTWVQIQNKTALKTYLKVGMIPEAYMLNVHVHCEFGNKKALG